MRGGRRVCAQCTVQYVLVSCVKSAQLRPTATLTSPSSSSGSCRARAVHATCALPNGLARGAEGTESRAQRWPQRGECVDIPIRMTRVVCYGFMDKLARVDDPIRPH